MSRLMDPDWRLPGFTLARAGDWTGPLTLLVREGVTQLLDAQGRVVLVLGTTPAEVFTITGSPAGLLKGPRD